MDTPATNDLIRELQENNADLFEQMQLEARRADSATRRCVRLQRQVAMQEDTIKRLVAEMRKLEAQIDPKRDAYDDTTFSDRHSRQEL